MLSNRVLQRDPPVTLTRVTGSVVVNAVCHWSAPAILGCDWLAGAGVTSEPESGHSRDVQSGIITVGCCHPPGSEQHSVTENYQ